MRATLHHRTDARPIQSRTCAAPTRAKRSASPAVTGLSQSADRPRRAVLRRWARDLSYRVATNRYVFYGLLLLAAGLFVGAITRQHEELWRAAASLGIATIVIGLIHVWLDARADRQSRRTSSKDEGT